MVKIKDKVLWREGERVILSLGGSDFTKNVIDTSLKLYPMAKVTKRESGAFIDFGEKGSISLIESITI